MPHKYGLGFLALFALTVPLLIATYYTLQFEKAPECGNGYMEAGETPEACCEDTGCLPSQRCVNHSCEKLGCGECEYASNNTCVKYMCCADTDCKAAQKCSVRNTCENITCECGQIKDRKCLSYECCENSQCPSGKCEMGKCAATASFAAPLPEPKKSETKAEKSGRQSATSYAPPQEQMQQPASQQAEQQACIPTNEMCDGNDNNCNGQTDEGDVCAVISAIPVNVLVLSYFPLKGSNIDESVTGIGNSLTSMRIKVSQLTTLTTNSLTRGSAYHGYKDSNSKPSLAYTVLDSKEFLKAEPVSTNHIPWNTGVFRPDYYLMLTSDVNICDYVDNQGVKEVWVWGYHYSNIEPVESDMAMGTISRAYWNHDTYGDVSNSEQTNDLPTCTKSYTLYNYNYGRGLGEALENHGHHIEAVLGFIDTTLWEKFKRPYGTGGVNSCGWTHSPPNTATDYDWVNEADAISNCEDWKPDGTGTAKTVDCHTWYGQTCLNNGGVEFKIWWMQNLPGKNNGLVYQGKNLKNWWDYLGDFDTALTTGKKLTS